MSHHVGGNRCSAEVQGIINEGPGVVQVWTELWQGPAETQVWRELLRFKSEYLALGTEMQGRMLGLKKRNHSVIRSFTHHLWSPSSVPGTRRGARGLQLNRTIAALEDLTD